MRIEWPPGSSIASKILLMGMSIIFLFCALAPPLAPDVGATGLGAGIELVAAPSRPPADEIAVDAVPAFERSEHYLVSMDVLTVSGGEPRDGRGSVDQPPSTRQSRDRQPPATAPESAEPG
ncbi:MAG TPA: hypothetical protein VD930_13850 [Gemmatimonadales bacterium]|nr:hypothetical protein [Gemmatimonadales bacterium]